MTEISIRQLGEDDWQEFQKLRLASLADSPDAFPAGRAEEEAFNEEFWRLRVRRSPRLVAEVEGQQIGTISVGVAHDSDNDELMGEVFGLWVEPHHRGTGVATRLVRAAEQVALAQGRRSLAYWVGSDNGRAVAFASGMGFRPTDARRPMRASREDDSVEEIAMVLPLVERTGPMAIINAT